ncbi:MAG: hypothetical protein ACYCQI_07150 [Gammaproteobacteria bacterium]
MQILDKTTFSYKQDSSVPWLALTQLITMIDYPQQVYSVYLMSHKLKKEEKLTDDVIRKMELWFNIIKTFHFTHENIRQLDVHIPIPQVAQIVRMYL